MKSLKTLLAAGAAVVALSGAQAFASCPANPPPASPCAQPGGTVTGSNISNTQTQSSDVSSTFTLDVGTTQNSAAAAVSGGNVASVGVQNQALSGGNSQKMKGAVSATSTAKHGTISGTSVNTAYRFANGFSAYTDGGNLNYGSTQTTGAAADVDVSARTTGTLSGANATATVAATGAGNVNNYSMRRGEMRTASTQTSNASVTARSEADLCCNNGSAASGAVATANNATINGSFGTLYTNTTQTSRGANVTAVSDLYVGGSSNTIVGAATANGYALTLSNEFGYVQAGATQTNSSNIMSQSWVTGGTFANGAASSYGVGNTAVMNNVGSDMRISFDKANSGAVQSWAALSGTGGVGAVNASAIGNASQGFLCTACGNASMWASITQTNSCYVEAICTLVMPSASHAAGAATAFGNASTFFVGDPQR
jgi:hypothetical protein